MSFSNLEIVDGDENEIKFEINSKDIFGIPLVNGIRRIANAEIENISIDFDSIDMSVNTSMIHEKLYAARLALCPLKIDNIVENFDNLTLKLNKENKNEGICDVLLSDFKVFDEDEKEMKIEEVVVYPEMLIGKLKYGQKIIMTASFKKGTASNYGASFSHSCGTAYHFKRDNEKLEELTKNMSVEEKKIFLIKEGDRHFLKNQFIFKVETNGSITGKQCFQRAIETYIEKLEFVKDRLDKVRRGKVEFVAYDFIFEDEDETLGNLVQTFLLKNKLVHFAGFVVPHPLNNILIIRMSLKDNKKNSVSDNTKVFTQTIDDILSVINVLYEDWKQM